MVMVSNMGEFIGRIFESSRERVLIAAHHSASSVSVGDILYVKLGRSLDRIVLLHVDDVLNKLPTGADKTLGLLPKNVEPSGALIDAGKEKTIISSPMFMIIKEGGKVFVTRPSVPPPLNIEVRKLERGDEESEEIMGMFSLGIPAQSYLEKTVPIAVLRSGSASTDREKTLKYFEKAEIKVDITSLIPKHILVSGQTGAGKTTGVMGMILNWALHGKDPVSWLIIDRHGEYSKFSKGGIEFFVNKLSKAILNNQVDEVAKERIFVYKFSFAEKAPENYGNVVIRETPINIGSLTVSDISMALEVSDEEAATLEMMLETLETIVEASDLSESWKNIFRSREGVLSGHLIPLLIAVIDNMCNSEGVGEREKKGIYREFVQQGIYIQKLRVWRTRLLALLNLRFKNVTENGGVITVYSDDKSIFKLSEVFKKPGLLRNLLEKIARSPVLRARQDISKYKWFRIRPSEELSILEGGLNIDHIIEKLEEGSVVILDVSSTPSTQADAVVLNVVRRILTNRIGLDPREIARRKVVAIVSEEAPLYLSPEKVRSPRNAFARIAREGRKFKIGLVAITQLATIIEKQLLANMNTIVVLRTKFRSDIEYFSSIGVPSSEIPLLNDREGYIYTPDIRVRDPIPAYFKGWFEIDVKSREEKLEDVAKMMLEV
mgnify:FL=1